MAKTFEEWWAENESAQRDRAKLAWKLVDEKVTEAKREMRERAALENCSMCMLPLIWKPETDGWHVLISDLRISAPFRERRRCLSESIRALPLDAPDMPTCAELLDSVKENLRKADAPDRKEKP